MDYETVSVDIKNPDVLDRINRLLTDVFSNEISTDRLEVTTRTESSCENLYVAAIRDWEVLGFSAFISHDFDLHGTSVNAYQCCWVATSGKERGKRIFQNLIEYAKANLMKSGASFIFGFPNENSQPIFLEKLGFREIPALKWQVPNILGVRDCYLRTNTTYSSPAERISQNDRQLMQLKKLKYSDRLIVEEDDGGLIWGLTRVKKRFGLSLQYFEIGGFDVHDGKHLKSLLHRLFARLRHIAYLQTTTCVGNSRNAFFRNLRPAQTNPLIVFDLNMDTSASNFDLFGGVKDVY